ncbi:MAG TPA: 2OG-Fe(II) oxygenase [Burkholderiales bacterium]|nr:2OG-Fe(II) oxygenase [Burkholderiales bacterium]
MQFVGDFLIDGAVCDRLIELHRACDRKGLVKRGRMGKGGSLVVDPEKKDSFDVSVDLVPAELLSEYGIERYYAELQRCLQLYVEQHPMLKQLGKFRVTESPAIQHYRPGGGFKMPHFERSGYATATRMLVWMTYLNDVTDGGGTHFVYQKHTFEAKKGRTLIWPSDFTHTHVGVVSPNQHKYIITGWMNFCPDA